MTKLQRRYRQEYEQDHFYAKLIILVIQVSMTVVAFFVTTGTVQIIIGIYLIKEILYYFGVNTIQYMLEEYAKHKHKVTKL